MEYKEYFLGLFGLIIIASPLWTPAWLEFLGRFVNREVYCFSDTIIRNNDKKIVQEPYTWFETALSKANEMKGFPQFPFNIFIAHEYIFYVLYGTIGFLQHLIVKGRQ